MTTPKKTSQVGSGSKKQVVKTYPTKLELEQATKKALAQYSSAVKNLAHR